ncbi:histidine kinase [Flavisolibacter sp. BT320]|nr:histidine kinase [Flavisolibacter longurius]
MKRIKRVFLWVHLVLWTLFGLLLALQLSQDTASWLQLTVAVMLSTLYVFYSHFYLLIRYSGKRKNRSYYLRLAAIIFSGPILYLLFHYRKLDSFDLLQEYYLVSLFSIVLPFIFLSWLARVTENLVVNTVKKEQLEKQAVEAELYYLKSQMAPHFLFNTLNNIYNLVYKQAPTAPDAVLQMASLMRYMLYESNAETVPLTRELAYLQDYTSLQQLRYKQSPVVDIKFEGEPEACYVSPLLFIHLLENAYKHSPAGLAPGTIKVTVAVKDDTLTFSVQNPVGRKNGNALDEPGGIGLPNVRKRLALLYPGQHSLDVHDNGEQFFIELKIHALQLSANERKAHLLYH